MFLCISWSVLLSGFIPQLITAAILIIGYIWQFRSFRTQIQTQNEIIEDVYDFFDTLGFLVIKHYLAADVAWNYFDHWFVSYYIFFKKYDIRKAAGYEFTVWNNMTELKIIFDNIEAENNAAIPRKEITTSGLKNFFSEELISD
jgi:hypothetical protein